MVLAPSLLNSWVKDEVAKLNVGNSVQSVCGLAAVRYISPNLQGAEIFLYLIQ
jgi:hypothetical protein